MNTLEIRGKVTKYENKKLRLKYAQIRRTYELPKSDKKFVNISSFWPIVDTAKYTTLRRRQMSKKNFLHPLLQNEYTFKELLAALQIIHKIPAGPSD